MSNVGLYPPQLSYLVDGTFASGSQDCKILIRGADVSGQDLFFVLALNQSLSLKSGKHFHFVDSSGSSNRYAYREPLCCCGLCAVTLQINKQGLSNRFHPSVAGKLILKQEM